MASAESNPSQEDISPEAKDSSSSSSESSLLYLEVLLSSLLDRNLGDMPHAHRSALTQPGLTIRDVLIAGAGDVGALRFLKDAAKRLAGPGKAQEKEAALAVYLGAIAAAWVWHHQDISSQPPDRLRSWILDLAAKKWVGPDLAAVLRRAGSSRHGLLAGSSGTSRDSDQTDSLTEMSGPSGLRVEVLRDGICIEGKEFSSGSKALVAGRWEDCDILLPASSIADKHLRLAWNPHFHRWLVEALPGARVQIAGKVLDAPAPAAGRRIEAGPFSLRCTELRQEEETAEDEDSGQKSHVADLPLVSMARIAEGEGLGITHEAVERLNEIGDQLADADNLEELYTFACRSLCRNRFANAVVLRIPLNADFDRTRTLAGVEASGRRDASQRIRFSGSVLHEVLSSGETVVARAQPRDAFDVQLTVVDEARQVVCIPVGRDDGGLLALYVDMPDVARAGEQSELAFLTSVARMVRLCRGSLLGAQSRAKWVRQQSELKFASEIQGRLLPEGVEAVSGGAIQYRYTPAMWVGGDYCDVWPLGDGRLAFAIGDVTGKGVPGALVISALHAALRAGGALSARPSQLVQLANEYLVSYTPDGMFVTMLLGFFTPETGHLEYVNAGHLRPFLACLGGQARELSGPSGLVMGIQDYPYQDEHLTLESNQGVLMVTDGITEAGSGAHELFGPEGVLRVLSDPSMQWSQLLEKLYCSAMEFAQGAGQQDDVTMLLLRRMEG